MARPRSSNKNSNNNGNKNNNRNNNNTILNYFETKMSREKFLCNKWLSINEDLAYKRTVKCTQVVDLKSTGMYLYK
jgi:hypothetical protein